MINERVNIIIPGQAGFWSNYITEDQVIRLTQNIQNGF